MTTRTIRYCANGCKSVYDGKRSPTQVKSDRALVCDHCEDQIEKWLREIPDHYALLPEFMLPGSAEKDPGSKATKAAYVALPVRLEVIDLLDQRPGRIWQGTAPAHDRRGVIGTLVVLVERLVDEKPLTPPTNVTVSSACSLLARHRLWIAEQEWVTLLHDDLKQLHRALADAVGIYRRPPVGRCQVLMGEGDDTKPCAGGLYPTEYGSVRCTRCGETWNSDKLRLLGMTLEEGRPGETAS